MALVAIIRLSEGLDLSTKSYVVLVLGSSFGALQARLATEHPR